MAPGKTIRPWLSRSTSNALDERNREKPRAFSSASGRTDTLAARASKAGRGNIAAQPSTHRTTTAPSSSCRRKRAGIATRPFASTECLYSPVNICLSPVCLCRGCGRGSRLAGRDRHSPGLCPTEGLRAGAAWPLTPTNHHLSPLPGIIHPLRPPSTGVSRRLGAWVRSGGHKAPQLCSCSNAWTLPRPARLRHRCRRVDQVRDSAAARLSRVREALCAYRAGVTQGSALVGPGM